MTKLPGKAFQAASKLPAAARDALAEFSAGRTTSLDFGAPKRCSRARPSLRIAGLPVVTLPAPSSPDMGSRVVRLEGQMEALLAVLIQDTPAPMPQVKPQVKPEDITVANWSNYEGRIGGVGRQEWLWEIFVKAEPRVLEKIECVTYTLHPSVSNPVRNVCDLGKSDRLFAASGESWATYTVDVTISFKESDAPDIHKAHTLTLASP